MKTKFTITAVIFAIAAFMLSRVLWPDAPGAIPPSSAQLPHFIFLGVVEAIAFGVGIAFAFFGWSKVRTMLPEKMVWPKIAFWAIVWLLVSWWPHDNWHRVTGEGNYWTLLAIEYLFHFTLILAGLMLARFFWKNASR